MISPSIKIRKSKKNLKLLIDLIKFKSLNFTKSKQLILVWLILSYISLFLNWIIFKNKLSENIFNNITFFPWIVIFIILLFLTFTLFSTYYKNNLKKIFKLNLKDSSIFIYFSILLFVISLIVLSNIIWLKRFEADIKPWNWEILMISASILIFIWAIFLKEENKQKNYLCVNESEEELKIKKEKDNMKLPF